MDRTSAPFAVLKPVLTTMAVAVVTLSPPRTRTILVPMNKKCLAISAGILDDDRFIFLSVASLMGILETGTDSPVSMDSLRMQSPDTSIASHGTVCIFAISIKSPGTNSTELTFRPTCLVLSSRGSFRAFSPSPGASLLAGCTSDMASILTWSTTKYSNRTFEKWHVLHSFHRLVCKREWVLLSACQISLYKPLLFQSVWIWCWMHWWWRYKMHSSSSRPCTTARYCQFETRRMDSALRLSAVWTLAFLECWSNWAQTQITEHGIFRSSIPAWSFWCWPRTDPSKTYICQYTRISLSLWYSQTENLPDNEEFMQQRMKCEANVAILHQHELIDLMVHIE